MQRIYEVMFIVRPDMPEEELIARAEVVQTRLAIRRLREAILGAAAMAGEPDVTPSAVLR